MKSYQIDIKRYLCKFNTVGIFLTGLYFMSVDPPDWHKKNKGKLEQAFKKALEEKREKQKEAERDKNSKGSGMIHKDKPQYVPRPKGAARSIADRKIYNKALSNERAQEKEDVRKARAAADDLKKRAPDQIRSSSKWQKDMGSANKKLDDAIAKARAEKDSSRSQNRIKSEFNRISGKDDHER